MYVKYETTLAERRLIYEERGKGRSFRSIAEELHLPVAKVNTLFWRFVRELNGRPTKRAGTKTDSVGRVNAPRTRRKARG